MERNYDILFVGGGLANSLLAWQIKRLKPWLRFLVLEKGKSLGGKHTWSFHEKDVPAEALDWLRPVISASWPFYQVIFPKYMRQLESRYFSIRSKKLHDVVMSEIGEQVRFETDVDILSSMQVRLNNGDILTAPLIVDGRGVDESDSAYCGFQKFVGLELELSYPHGLKGPILMDASVEQKDGYRFFYCLPWSETRLLVEDTRYSGNSNLEVSEFRKEIMSYCQEKNWVVKEVFDEESGCLPLPLSSRFFEALKTLGIPIGMRAGLFHPTTGYSLPLTVKTIDQFLKAHKENQWPHLQKMLMKSESLNQRIFIWLNRVMFGATHPEKRYTFLQHFYELPETLVDAFYAHQMTFKDWVRFFLRTPPVKVISAFKALKWEAVRGNSF